jgi:hypothetical protein
MKRPSILLAACIALGSSASSQTVAPIPTQAATKPRQEEALVLSPFQVNATSDTGYAATSTLGGTRLNSELKDVASQIDVMTADFLSDIGALTLDEALKYSINIELASENMSPTSLDDASSVNVFGALNGSRTRGLTRSNNTHDFFETNFPIDSYNTGKRFTLVSGSNAILFGAGLAGGTNDASFERPDLRRIRGTFNHRTDNVGSHRGSINISVPLVKQRLAIRGASLLAREQDYREGAGSDIRRNYGTILFQPHQKISIRAWAEQNDIRIRQGVNSITTDYVTRWIESGKPAFENLGVLSTSAQSVFTAAFGPSASATFYSPLSNSAARIGGNASSRPVIAYNANGSLATNVFPQLWTNAAVSLSHNTGSFLGRNPATGGSLALPSSQQAERAILDPSVYPLDESLIGNTLQRRMKGNVQGFLFELNPFKNIYVEGGYNQEDFTIDAFSFITGNDSDLFVDVNRYLPNLTPGTTVQSLNPNFGKFYVEDDLNANFWKNRRDEKRVQVAFAHDPAPPGSWRRWLGNHRGAVMVAEANNKRVQQNNNLARIISSNVIPGVTGANAAALLDPAANQLNTILIPRIRHYIEPQNGLNSAKLPFNPWKSSTYVVGKDANGADIVVFHGVDNPYGVGQSMSNGLKTDKSFQVAVNSSFWDNRIITTLGKRISDATYASWVPAERQPRYNAANRQYEVPVNGRFPSNGALVGNAGYESAKTFFEKEQYLLPPVQYDASSVLKSIVVHPTRWLSFHYTDSSSSFVAEYTNLDPDNGTAKIEDGTTREYGFSIRLIDNRLSLKFNHYTSVSRGQFALGNGVTISGTGSVQDSTDIRYSIINLEKATFNILGGASAIPTANNPYRQLMTEIVNWDTVSNPSTSTLFGEYGRFHDREASGNEITLTANPTRAWTLRASAAMNETKLQNITAVWFDYIDYRLATWKNVAATAGTTPFHNTTGAATTYAGYFGLAARTWQTIKQSEGQLNTQEAKYRVRFTTAYDFANTNLKGFRIGGGARWDSARAFGYYRLPLSANNPYFNYPEGGFTVPDTTRPIYGKPLLLVDGFISYKRKIARDLKWSIGLNIRNLANNKTRVPTNAIELADGSLQYVRFTIPEPRTFVLSNSIEF